MKSFTSKAYHGTFWTDEAFDRPNPAIADSEASWLSNSRSVSEKFSTWNSTPGDHSALFVVMEGEIELRRPFIFDPDSSSSLYVDVGHGEFHVAEDRDQLYQALKAVGYDGMIIRSNYGDGQDDIAYFDEDAFSPRVYYVSEDALQWSEAMDFYEADEKWRSVTSPSINDDELLP